LVRKCIHLATLTDSGKHFFPAKKIVSIISFEIAIVVVVVVVAAAVVKFHKLFNLGIV
jgi:hypothetical protein